MYHSISPHIWQNKQSQEAKSAADQQQAFATTLQNQYKDQFGQNSATQQYLVNRLQGVFNRANAGQGFNPNELATLQTNNDEATAQAAQQGQQATARRIAQLSGGGSTPSGTAAQVLGQVGTGVANAGAAGLRDINLQNSALARSTATNTLSQLGGASGSGLSFTNGLSGNAVGQGGQAFNAINTAYKPSNFWGNLGQGLLSGGLNALAGVATGGLSTAMSGLFKRRGGGGGFSNGSDGSDGFQGA